MQYNLRMKYTLRLLIVFIFAACYPGWARKVPAHPALLSAADPVKQLRANLDRVFGDPKISPAQLGVEVFSLDRSETLYAMNPQRLFIPASCNKLISAAVALMRLGPGYRFETRLLADGRIEDGTLNGNLLVVGYGDPSNSGRFHEGDPFAAFKIWAAELKRKDIRKISGDIIGDDAAFAEPRFGFGWEWNDLTEGYAAPISSLQFNDNAVSVEIVPGPEKGNPALVRTLPLDNYFTINNQIVTGPEKSPVDIRIERGDSNEAIAIYGSVPAAGATLSRTVAVRNPAIYFLSAFKRTLSEEGIDSGACSIRIRKAYDSPSLSLLWTNFSPDLSEILKPLLKESLNLQAETLVRTLGMKLRGDGSFDKGKEVVEETLSQMGIAPGSYAFADGSGLSRRNLESADNLVRVLRFMYRGKNFQQFLDALPIAGIDGTLSARLKGTKAENNIRAKTGSMTGVSSISGYLKTADAEMLAFSVGANNFPGSRELVESAQDRALVILAGFSRNH